MKFKNGILKSYKLSDYCDYYNVNTNKDDIDHKQVNQLILKSKYTTEDVEYLNKFIMYSVQDIITTTQLMKHTKVIDNKISQAKLYNVPLRYIF